MNKEPILPRVDTIALIAITGAFIVVSRFNYLLFHASVELFSVVVAGGVFIIGWNGRRYLQNKYLLIVAIGYASVASLDFLHTLAYEGMGIFPGYSPNLPTQLWLAARSTEAATLIAAPLLADKPVRILLVASIYVGTTSVFFATIFADLFPVAYQVGSGLTPFKIIAEYVIILGLVLAAGLLLRIKNRFDETTFWYLVISIGCTILGEIAFTLYVSLFGISNLVGHIAKLLSFYFIYKAIVITGATRPQDLLYRDLARSQEAYRAQANLLQRTEALAGVGSWRWDISTDTWHLSPGWLAIHGCVQKNLGTDQLIRIAHPDDATAIRAAFQRAVDSGVPYEITHRVVRQDTGEVRWVESYGEIEYDHATHAPRVMYGAAHDITRAVLQEEELRTRLNQVTSMIENIPGSVWIVDREYRFVRGNIVFKEAFSTAFGRELTTGMSLVESVAPELQNEWIEYYDRALAGETFTIERKRVHAKAPTYTEYHFGTIPGEHGTSANALVLAYDITDRKIVEEQLAESEMRFRTQYDSAPIPIFTWIVDDGVATLERVNPAAIEVSEGYASRFVGQTATEVYPDRPDIIENLLTAYRKRERIQHRSIYVSRGSRRHKVINFTYTYAPPNIVMLYVEDITERERAEQALRDSLVDLKLAQTISHVGYWQFDPAVGTPVWSEEVYRIHEWDAAAGPPHIDEYRSLYEPDQFEVFTSHFSQAVQDGTPYDITIRLRFPRGHVKWLRTVCQPDPEATPAGHVLRGTIQDVTESKLREDRLEQLNAQKEILIREINHRVKNNLAMVRSLIELKNAEIGADVDLSDLSSQIEAIRIVHEKLYQTEDVTRVEMRDYIQDLLKTIFGAYHGGSVRVVNEVEDCAFTSKHAVSVGLIINELATNAMKHGFVLQEEAIFSISLVSTTKRNGTTDQNGTANTYTLTVANTGRPFPPDIDIRSGTTLGLRLVVALVEQIAGTIDLVRDPVPEFTIRFSVPK